jgi:hypothetical protein
MASSYVQRVEFTSDVDELADAYVRYVLATPAGQSMRRRGVATTWAGCALLAFALMMMDPSNRAAGVIAPAVLVALLSGGLAALVYALSYHWSARRRLRRFLAIQFGADGFTCEIELRDDGLWARQELVEVTFHWRDLISAEDTNDGVELRFHGGYVLARNRGFWLPLDRLNFLDNARMLGARVQLDERSAARAARQEPAPRQEPPAPRATIAIG